MKAIKSATLLSALCLAFGPACDADIVEPSEEEVEAEDIAADEQQADQAPSLPLAEKPDPAEGPDGKECCALCNNRNAYHALWGVSNNCNYWAYYWCDTASRGGLKDAAWLNPSQCLDP